jgi:hypothetical protein
MDFSYRSKSKLIDFLNFMEFKACNNLVFIYHSHLISTIIGNLNRGFN